MSLPFEKFLTNLFLSSTIFCQLIFIFSWHFCLQYPFNKFYKSFIFHKPQRIVVYILTLLKSFVSIFESLSIYDIIFKIEGDDFMGTFTGTKLEFKKYFGGYCRNKVHEITNQYRKSRNGMCEYCKNKEELQAAHVQGAERVKIIELILDRCFKVGDDEYLVDLDDFEKEFIKAHRPIDKNFHFLCHKCHSKYDKGLLSEAEILRVKDNNNSKIIESKNKKLQYSDNKTKNSICEKYRNTSDELYKNENESIQDYVKRLLNILFSNNLLSENLVLQLQNREYCAAAFGINYPLLEQDINKIRSAGRARYYTTFKLQNKYYVCKEWWKEKFPVYEKKLKDWVNKITKS